MVYGAIRRHCMIGDTITPTSTVSVKKTRTLCFFKIFLVLPFKQRYDNKPQCITYASKSSYGHYAGCVVAGVPQQPRITRCGIVLSRSATKTFFLIWEQLETI